MTKSLNPCNTFLQIAALLRSYVEDRPAIKELPSAAELMDRYQISRGVALRAFEVLESEGIAQRVPGSRWRVVRDLQTINFRPLADRIADVILEEGLEVGAEFPSTTVLCDRFSVSRPTVRRALDKLEAQFRRSTRRRARAGTVSRSPHPSPATAPAGARRAISRTG